MCLSRRGAFWITIARRAAAILAQGSLIGHKNKAKSSQIGRWQTITRTFSTSRKDNEPVTPATADSGKFRRNGGLSCTVHTLPIARLEQSLPAVLKPPPR